jgi:ribosome-binding protein aMBF1 (putative translation factor)
MEARQEHHVLHQRYENAVRSAHRWLQEHKRSQTWLADEIGVERSVLSRFLNPEAQDYKPESSRPRMLMILEGIERVCTDEKRDIFLSHSSRDKEFVRRLAADIESEPFNDRYWLPLRIREILYGGAV